MRISVLVLAAAFGMTLTTGARAQRTRRDSSSARRVSEQIGVLAADSMEGRDTGSRGGAAAARYIAAQLERAGLQPAGDSGWFQRVPLAWVTITNPQNGQTRRVMRLQPSFAARDTFPVSDRVTAVNVAGILVGSDPVLKDEAIVIDAHYDHIGVVGAGACRTTGADSVCNGADDDASGTVAVMEVARMLASAPAVPKRSIVFLLVTGEERGTLGSRWYLEHPVVPIAATVANLEIEMIGRPDSLAGGAGKAWLTGYDRSSMGQMLRDNGIPLVADPRPDQHFFERSDNIAFAYRGVPAHTISSFNLHNDYHQPSDEARFVDAAHMAAVINATARATRLLADGPAPTWAPGGKPEPPARRN
jgi:Zn-dependent M28 family amino/carboxypeptidase